MCIHLYVCIDGHACIIKAVSSSWAGDVFGIIYILNTSVTVSKYTSRSKFVWVWVSLHIFGYAYAYVFVCIRLCFKRDSVWMYVCLFVFSYDCMYVCVFIYDVNVGVVLDDENNIIYGIRLQIWMQLRYTKEHIILLLITR